MAFYFFYQQEQHSVWIPALADERANILRTKKPALCTVLDVDSTFEEDMTSDQRAAVKYRGPLYWDVDSENIPTAIEQTQKLLTLIKSKGVDLDMLRIYLTGGRGAHILMDPAIFMPKIPATGIANLPAIYKEMVWSAAFVDDVDMRVYSSGKGRQLRCVNYQRDNNLYKVSVTADEVFGLTPEKYEQLCSSPRNEVPLATPKFNPDFGLAFSVAQDKVSKSASKRKSKKSATDTLKKFKNEWPETLTMINSGVGIREDAGFNQIAMQVAITGLTLGKNEDQILESCAGLIDSHRGDSARYGTPAKRRAFLREMIRYCDNNPLYEYSAGAVANLIQPELKSKADILLGDYVPDPVPPSAEAQVVEDGPIQLSSNGVFVRTGEGFKSICDLGLTSPVTMCKLDGDHIGFEVNVTLDGEKKGRKFIPMNAFASKGQFNNWALLQGASMRGSDVQTSNLADIFRKRTTKVVYAVEREGVDIITPPGTTDVDIIWASPDGVETLNKDSGINYRYHGVYSAQGTYKSDLMTAPKLSAEDEGFIQDLLRINSTGNLAKLLGWFSAAFLTQLIRKKFKRFPSLQLFGQAGAGKSMTIILLNHMHYHQVEPRQFAVAGQTMFPIIAAMATSASIPLVFEEVKARQLNKTMKDFLQNMLRSNYTADQLSRGSLGRDKSVRELTVTDFSNAAPVAFVGEALEDQSAILERCVVVALSKTDRTGKDAYFERCLDNAQTMGRIGKALALAAMAVDRELLHTTLNAHFKAVSGKVAAAMADDASRPAFNLAVVLTGLDFLKSTLSETFGTTFDARLDEMRDAILNNVMDSIPRNMAEASRVLDTMAMLTRASDPQVQLIKGVDYTISEDGRSIDLKLRTAFDKYVRYTRGLGMEVLFDSHNAWQAAMTNYGGTTKRACPENEDLWDSLKAVVFRVSTEYMAKEGVDSFEA